eukprot:TRINITY_DN6795_c0_g1_i1.p1 TRINITY_DN6795_c0_g1~~TRINITY_DN6795_c0_g1_i1.p1  ORF type:complete len:115 (+),score=4.43 TRINITY_DN6795_c0_g1_i1:84-428(+)
MIKDIIASARLKNIKVSPRKAMLVADVVRGRKVANVLSFLENTRKNVNPHLFQLIKSAIANAQQKDKDVDVDKLVVRLIQVDKGFVLKRMRPRAMGRGSLIRKRSSHIYVGLGY